MNEPEKPSREPEAVGSDSNEGLGVVQKNIHYCPFCSSSLLFCNSNAIQDWLECDHCGFMFQIKSAGFNPDPKGKWVIA